jgi:crotonobetainyl-CoA:carnitine CoA-transferase CaiB-like acyl-CoA transferase
MKHPGAMNVLGPLIDWADLVVENFSPGTMDKLGLGFSSLQARKPGIVMVSGSVYGQTGPLAAEWGVDGTGGALSGRTFLTGWADRDPVVPGAVPYGDVILPFVMAAAALATLQARRETGQGAHIDASMYEVCVQQMARAIHNAQAGERPYRAGNADHGIHHQDVYPAAGEDRWVAITLHSDAEAERLAELAGTNDIAQWTAARNDRDIVDVLQAEGIAAAVVQDIEDLVEHDPMIAVRGALVELQHPLLGAFGHMRTPLNLSATPVHPFRAPSLGEHCRQVACDIGGLGEAEFDALDAEGLFE